MEQQKLKCVNCGKPLTGKQKKFCCSKCRFDTYNKNRKDYFRDYQRNYMRKFRRYKCCVICGSRLPKYRHRYCSDKCRIKGNKEFPTEWDLKTLSTLPVPTNKNNKCEECSGDLIFMDNEYFCKNCGLVVV